MKLSEEGYDVILITYPSPADLLQSNIADARGKLGPDTEWALLTYGLESGNLAFASQLVGTAKLKAIAHYCPQIEDGKGLVHEFADGSAVPCVLLHFRTRTSF